MKNILSNDIMKWSSVATSLISLLIIIFVKSKYLFESGNFAGKLVLLSMITALVSVILSIMVLPRWQGIISLLIAFCSGYLILFTPLYAIQ